MRTTATALLALTLMGGLSFAKPQRGDDNIQGKLIVEKGSPALLDRAGKRVRITSDDDSISETLGDARLAGRELKLVGRFASNGQFKVDEFYVVHGSSLFRLIYFCDTCHITTFRPGNCLCCQQPTVPTEVPLTDARVYHEDIKPLNPK